MGVRFWEYINDIPHRIRDFVDLSGEGLLEVSGGKLSLQESPKGDQGEVGPQGEQGVPGPKGDTGEVGPQGEQGVPGPKGDTGDTGETGPQGLPGVKGDTGDTGAAGPQGIQGLPGPKGDTGDTGETGPQGLPGVKGDTGDTGATGPQGIQGVPGLKGDTGATGPQGPQGVPGPTNFGTTAGTAAEGNKFLQLVGGTITGIMLFLKRIDVGNGSDGTSTIRILKGDNNLSDHIQFFHGTTRMGEIGCQDISWFRINQVTPKNIYTPRTIRADGGFQVFGKWVASPDGNVLYENSTPLSSKYLGINAQAADSDKVDGLNAGSFIRSDVDTGLFDARITFAHDQPSSSGITGGLHGGLELRSTGSGATAGAAFMTFHRPGAYAFHFGIDTDNQLKVGGWSMGSNSYKVWHAGNDGSGSGLDADLWDGWQRNNYLNQSVRSDGSPTFNTIYSDWFRAKGDTGFYCQSWGGGIHMIDDVWLRVYNNKQFYVSSNSTPTSAGDNAAIGCPGVRIGNGKIYTSDSISTGSWLTLSGASPTVQLHDNSGGRRFWLRNDSNIFYILSDIDDDGAWESPHPAYWHDVSKKSYFWDKEVSVIEAEGAFTPTLRTLGSSVGPTYLTRNGYYKVVGGILYYWIQLVLSSGISSGSNQLAIYGLPIKSAPNNMYYAGTVGLVTNLVGVTGQLVVLNLSNTDYLYFHTTNNGVHGDTNYTMIGNGSQVHVSGNYPV